MPYVKLPESNGHVLCYKAEGPITDLDYTEHLIPTFHSAQKISPNNKVRLLVDIRGIKLGDFNLAALWEDTKFGISENSNMERIAVIGDKAWEEFFINASKPLLSDSEIEFFREKVEKDGNRLPSAALQWIFAGSNLAPSSIIKLSYEDVSNNSNEKIEKANPFIHDTNWIVCLDETEESQIALREALRLINKPQHQTLHFISIYGKKNEEKIKLIVEEAIKYANEYFDVPISVESHSIFMPYSHTYPGAAIIDTANKIRADYLVMGNRGRGTLKKFILGSVSRYVVEHSSCPVILCKKPENNNNNS